MLSRCVEVESSVSVGLRNEPGALLLRIGRVLGCYLQGHLLVHSYDRIA
jgi:hypothetical protein